MLTKIMKNAVLLFVVAIMLTSCYSYTSIVGKGPQGNQELTEWNHYILFGLAPVGVSDSKQMAGGAADYSVWTRQSFVNGLCSAITFGIYSPTTTTVKK